MKRNLLSLALASALVSGSAFAEIQFSGFASIVAGTTGGSDEVVEGFENYAGRLDFQQESLVALQATSDLGEKVGVTVQITARGIEDWEPQFEWAYVSYDVNDSLRILAGRQRIPFFMYSDFLDVSYAYPWITPQQGVYDLVFDSLDGLGAIYNTSFGNVDATFHATYGNNTEEFEIAGVGDVTPEFDNIVGLATTFTYEWLTLRAGYFQANLEIPTTAFDELVAGINGTIASLPAGFLSDADINNLNEIAEDQLIVSQDTAEFLEFGFQMNFDKLRIIGEYTELTIDDTPFADDEQSYYVTAAYPVGDVLLHLTYGADENTRSSVTSDIPAALGALATSIDDNTVVSQDIDTSYITLGARYDFHESAAFKVEYTNFSSDDVNTVDADILRVALVTVF